MNIENYSQDISMSPIDSKPLALEFQTSEQLVIAETEYLQNIITSIDKVDFAVMTHSDKESYITELREKLKSEKDEAVKQDIREKLMCFEPKEKVKASIVVIVLLFGAMKKGSDLACIDGQVFCYNGRYWEHIEDSLFKTFLADVAIRMGIEKFHAIKVDFKDLLFRQFFSTANTFTAINDDTNKVVINLKDRAFVCEENKTYFRDFDKNDYKKYCLPFTYDPDTKCPKFQKFLNTVLPSKDMQEIVREYIGYVFTGLKLEKALFLIGDGANGKSTLINIIAALLGKNHNVCYNSVGDLCDKSGYYRTGLSNYLLNVCTEFSSRFDPQVLKQLISGEAITARTVFREPVTISNYCKFIFSANVFPRKDIEHSHGFNRRLLILWFNQTIPPEEQNPHLADEIINNELSGIFNWVLVGLERIMANKKFTITAEIQKGIDDFQRQNDSLLMFIEDAGYVKSLHNHVTLKDLYSEYVEFCTESRLLPISKPNFRKQLELTLKFRVKDKCTNNAIWVFCEKIEYIPNVNIENDPIIQSIVMRQHVQ